MSKNGFKKMYLKRKRNKPTETKFRVKLKLSINSPLMRKQVNKIV